MHLTGNTILDEIHSVDNPNEGRVKINDNFKKLGYSLGKLASTYVVSGQTISTIDKEKPTGPIDGLNTNFQLQYEPFLGSEHVYLNGVLQENGYGLDYIIDGSTIVFFDPPIPGMRIVCSYRS